MINKNEVENQLKNLIKDWLILGTFIHRAELQRESLKESMQELLEGLGIDKYEDSEGNLWVLKRDSRTKEPWCVMYVPIKSRLNQNPKFQGATK